LEGAALNVRVNLNGLDDPEFVGWKDDEVQSLRSTSALMLEEVQAVVDEKLQRDS
jgi:formiminotetrahydrofolate cyclodeaminase